MLAVLLAPSLATAAPAGVVTLHGDTFEGVGGYVYFHNLNTSNNDAYFTNDHLWIYDQFPNYWIEAGVDIGTSAQLSVSSPTFEWIDQRPGDGYHEHQLGPVGDASYNTNYYTNIKWQGGGIWQIYAGPYSGYSTGNFNSGQDIFAGGETNDPSGARMCEHDSSLGYYNASGQAVYGWQDASNGQAVVWSGNSDPPYANWISRPTSERSYDNESSSC